MRGFSKEIDSVGEAADKVFTSQEEYNEGANERLYIDNNSDSWLAKNIRPLTLIMLMVAIFYILLFNPDINNAVIEMIKYLTGTAFIFYFGTRGGEKMITKYFNSNTRITKRNKKNNK